MKILKYIMTSSIAIGLLTVLSPCPTVQAAAPEAGTAGKLKFSIKEEDTRVNQLERFLKSHDSPMANEAEHFVKEADRFNLDWRLVAAIAGTESTFGKHVPPASYNGWGWGIPTGAQSGIAFQDWEHGITTVSQGLKTRYKDRGATTIEDMGRIYAASPVWANHVHFFLNKIMAYKISHPEELDITL